MSTDANKAVMKRIYEEVFNMGIMGTVDELVDTNYVYHGPGGDEFKGPERFKEFATEFRIAFPDVHIMIEDMVAEGDRVVLRATFRGTHKGQFRGIPATGRVVTVNDVVIARFADGREVEGWYFVDSLSLLRQLGVAPPLDQL